MEQPLEDYPEEALLASVNRILAPQRVVGIRRIGRGQSNPTYLLDCVDRKLVLRSKPPGKLLKSAHLVEREYRVMASLMGSTVPVPKTLALVGDQDSPLGRAFYVMEHVEGDIHFDPTLPGIDPKLRAVIYDDMNRVLSNLHQINVGKIGLADFGKPGNYYARQTSRWTQQYHASRTSADPNMDTIAEWLQANMVEDDGQVSLVHGDYRLDNLVVDRRTCKIRAVLDWELSTLGHPLADLAYQCMQWRMPHDGALRGLEGVTRRDLGLPEEEDYVADYCRRRRIGIPRNWTFYLVFAFFRLAAILEGVGRRALEGNASNPAMAVEYGRQVPLLAERAMEALESHP